MKAAALLAVVLAQPLSAITIKIDYSYDTNNFFNTQAKKNAIEAVAKFYGDLINDTLLPINQADFPPYVWTAQPLNPQTGATVDIPNLVVPLNTIIVFVGARDLSGSTLGLAGPGGWSSASGSTNWFNRIRGRGNPGAAITTANLRTDFAPWGGSIAFDNATTWNFSTTQNLSGSDFVSVALHEMGHVLGIGTADSWFNKISSLSFNGAACIRAHGSMPSIQSGNGHFDGDPLNSEAFGSFNVPHGTLGDAMMLPVIFDDGSTLNVATDLDLAALVDIGWEILPPNAVTTTSLGPAGSAFSWKSSSFFNYKLQRSTDLVAFTGGSASLAGTGGTQTWTDPSPLADKAFYRLSRTQVFSQPVSIPPPAAGMAVGPQIDGEEPRFVEGCGH
jgi:Matrixin